MLTGISKRVREINTLRLAAKTYFSFSRKVNTPIKRTAFLTLLLAAGARFQSLFFLVAAVNAMDDRVDGMRPLPEGMTAEGYLDSVDRFMAGLPNARQISNVRYPEEFALIAQSVRFFFANGLPNIADEICDIWQDYAPDARRTAHGQAFPDEDVLEAAERANGKFISLCLRCLGAPTSRAERFAHLVERDFVRSDTLSDLASDLERGSVLIPFVTLEAANIEPHRLIGSRGWPEIFGVPGVPGWYAAELEELEARWSAAKDQLESDVRSMLPPYFYWKATHFFILGKHVQNLREAREALRAFGGAPRDASEIGTTK